MMRYRYFREVEIAGGERPSKSIRFWDVRYAAAYQQYRFNRIWSERRRLQELCRKYVELWHRNLMFRRGVDFLMEVLGNKVLGKQQICMHIASYLV